MSLLSTVAPRSHRCCLLPQLHRLDALLPNGGVGSPDELARVYPPEDELFARCNLQEATLGGLFTSCPCKGQGSDCPLFPGL